MELVVQLTLRDAARLLGVAEGQIYRWVDGGEIPFSRVNDQFRFNQTEILEWAVTRRLPISNPFAGEGDGSPRLALALAVGGIHHGVVARDRTEVLRLLVGLLPLAEDERELLYGILAAREAAGSTAVGDGIAIPHVRSPIVAGTTAGSVTLLTLATAVPFGAPDGQPVHTVFSIVSPSVQTHLHLLGKVASALRDGAFKSAVLRRAPAAEIVREAERVEAATPVIQAS
jgi:PTS system nitrogen regulatory IIA component